jgi:hypothetical protein
MIEYYDNIPEKIVSITEQLIFSKTIQWCFLNQTVNLAHLDFQNQEHFFGEFQVLERYSHSAILYPFGGQSKSKEIDQSISPITKYIALEIIKKPVEIKRIMVNMHSNYDKNVIAAPHQDSIDADGNDLDKYLTFLYYVNDSSGDTFFFDDNKELIKRVCPKRGTGVLFNSRILHAGSYPKDENSPRCVINFMYKYV